MAKRKTIIKIIIVIRIRIRMTITSGEREYGSTLVLVPIQFELHYKTCAEQ